MADTIANASLRVAWSTSVNQAAAHLSLSLDEAMHRRLYGEARTSFAYGEAVYLRVHAWPMPMALQYAVSDGTLSPSPGGVESCTELLAFSGAPTASLSLPAVDDSLRVVRWLGTALPGTLACQGTRVTAQALAADALVAAVALVEYRVAWQGRRLALPVRETAEWTISLAVRGQVTEGAL